MTQVAEGEQDRQNLMEAYRALYALIDAAQDPAALLALGKIAFTLGSVGRQAYPELAGVGSDMDEWAALKAEGSVQWAEDWRETVRVRLDC